jgi:hypothetical protein
MSLTTSSTPFLTGPDMAEFSRLPDAARREVVRWHAEMLKIDGASHGSQGRLIARAASAFGLTEKAVTAKLGRWRKEGWRALCNRSRYKGSTALPPEFIEFWRAFIRPFQRTKSRVKAARRKLLLRLEAWEREGGAEDSEHRISGYEVPPRRNLSTRLPAGWDYNTLRRYAPDKAERTMSCQGPKKYSAFTPPVMSTRIGMEVGQLIFFDDQQADVWINFPNVNREAMRPLGFAALDYVSGCRVMTGWKPAMRRPDGTKEMLSPRDFYWFVIGWLTNYGWRPDTGTVLGMEMGTASVEDWFKEAVAKVTGGKVTMDHSGRFGDPAFRGMLYEGQSGGNFRWKGAIESAFNLERNEAQMLRAPTGRNRDEAPEETYGLKRYDAWLLKQMAQLPDDKKALLMLPALEWGKFTSLMSAVIRIINERTDHALTDFREMGFSCQELWMPGMPAGVALTPEYMAALDDAQRTAIHALSGTTAVRSRLMKPAEVWEAGRKGMRRLKGWHLPLIMRPEDALELKLGENFLFDHEDREISGNTLHYIGSEAVNERGQRIRLKRGEVYRCYLNPFSPDRLQVCERTGEWIGECARWDRVNRTDADAVVEAMIASKDAVAAERADMARRAESTIQQRTADYRWNKDVIAGAVKTPRVKKDTAAREEVLESLKGMAPALPAAGDGDDEDVMREAFRNE